MDLVRASALDIVEVAVEPAVALAARGDQRVRGRARRLKRHLPAPAILAAEELRDLERPAEPVRVGPARLALGRTRGDVGRHRQRAAAFDCRCKLLLTAIKPPCKAPKVKLARHPAPPPGRQNHRGGGDLCRRDGDLLVERDVERAE